MTVSTDGVICFGIYLGEDLPCEDMHEWDYDWEEWWRVRNGYKPPFEMFTEEGNWIGGKEWPQEKKDEYYANRRAWDEKNPIPFDLINVCGDGCPEWIMAVPGSETRCSRGDPIEITADTVSMSNLVEASKRFKAFCEEMGIEEEPKWYLGSYWG